MKITVLSDTHNFEPDLPGGDLLIHAGDLTKFGFRSEVVKQLNYLHENLDKYQDVLVIPGNHDLWAERHLNEFKEACLIGGLLTLFEEELTIQGLRVWGSPVTKRYHDWAFNKSESELYDIWEKIPQGIDILVTHSPPEGVLDLNRQGIRIGCKSLTQKVKEIKPLVHVFGHCHEDKGILTQDGITYINAAKMVVNFELDPVTRTLTFI